MRMTTLCLKILLVIGCSALNANASPPNVLIFLTDDQGWGDLSVNGNTNLSTPHIDSLSRQGATLENFYVCQVCAPTRAEFLTGRYYPRTGVSGVSRGEERLNPEESTIADFFKAAGYATGCFGKWHNGTQPPYHPNDRGFDEFYGFTSGHWSHYFSPILDHNRKRVRGNGFIADDITNHALQFIEQHQDQPFFCYLPFNTPHSPMMVPDRFYKKFESLKPAMRHRDPKREDLEMTRAALALCENIDWNIGRVLQRVEALNLKENTIVIFFCDNGPNSFRWNGHMKGRKGSLDEGGLRSPCYVRWPKKIKAGTKIQPIAGAIDLLPTLAKLSQINFDTSPNQPLDGADLSPLLLNKTSDWTDRHLYSIRRNQVSVRNQKYRLDADGRLFDIESDRGQTVDVSDRFPEVTADLSRQAKHHLLQMSECFQSNRQRPFTVGYHDLTTLPARDAVAEGKIRRSSKAPNNSFFTNWTEIEDSIGWTIEVGRPGLYEATVYYTCKNDDRGFQLQLSVQDGDSTKAVVEHGFDPPLFDKSKERVTKSHYFMKNFRPLPLGTLRLDSGTGVVQLKALDKTGSGLIDVHSIELVFKNKR